MFAARFVAWMISGLTIALSAGAALAQDFPSKPIRIVTSAPGGGNDYISRLVAQGITGQLGQPVIIDNRGSDTSAQFVSKSAPDGYVLLLGSGSFVTGPLLTKVPFDPVNDFSPVILLSKDTSIVIVHPSLPVRTIKELIALAKAKPGQLNYASGGTGNTTHLASELFKAMVGVDIVRINYKGTGPALNALMGGEVQVMFASQGGVEQHIRSGRLRALAITSSQPSALAPGLPTVAGSGVPGYEAVGMTLIMAPAKTPAAPINRLNQEFTRAINQPDIKEKLLAAGQEVTGGPPTQLASALKAEREKWARVIKDAGIKVE